MNTSTPNVDFSSHDDVLAELDVWVAEETAALVQKLPQPGNDQAPPKTDPSADVIDARQLWPRDRSRHKPGSIAPDDPPMLVPDGGSGQSDLFSDDEEAFMEQTVAWLVARENADTLLEEIWRRSAMPGLESEEVVIPLGVLPEGIAETEEGEDCSARRDDGDQDHVG